MKMHVNILIHCILVVEGVSANDTKLIEAIVKYLNTNPTFESEKEILLMKAYFTLRKKVSIKSHLLDSGQGRVYTV